MCVCMRVFSSCGWRWDATLVFRASEPEASGTGFRMVWAEQVGTIVGHGAGCALPGCSLPPYLPLDSIGLALMPSFRTFRLSHRQRSRCSRATSWKAIAA